MSVLAEILHAASNETYPQRHNDLFGHMLTIQLFFRMRKEETPLAMTSFMRF